MTFEQNLTQSEIDTLLSYYKNEPDNFAHAINQTLRAGDGTKNRFATSIADLDTSIAKGRCCHQVLYRASCLTDVQPFIKGAYLTYPAFMSTSAQENTIKQHYPGALTCVIPVKLCITGVYGIAAAPICTLSFTSNDEAEILLGRNAVFSVGSCEGVISPDHIRRVFGYFPPPGPSVGFVLGLRFKHYTTTA